MLKRVFYISVHKRYGGYDDSPEYDTLKELYDKRGEWIDKQESKLISILSKFVNIQSNQNQT